MDTRRRSSDESASKPPTSTPQRSAEITTDTGSVQVVELGTIGPPRRSAAATALLVLSMTSVVVVGGVVLLNRPSLQPVATAAPTEVAIVPIATAVPSPSPTSRPRPTPTPRPTDAPWVWQPYDLAGFDAGTRARRIVSLGDQFVALLSTPLDDSEDPKTFESIILSVDGSAWTRAVLPAPGFRVEHTSFADGSLALLGWADDSGDTNLQAWVTGDGLSWERDPELERMVEDFEDLTAVAHGITGWIAVGRPRTGGNGGADTELRYPREDGGWGVSDLAIGLNDELVGLVGGYRGFVAAIARRASEPDGQVELLHSASGAIWDSVDTLPASHNVRAMTVGVDAFVVVGEDRSGIGSTRPFAYRSFEGVTWQRARMPLGVLPPGLSTVGAFRVVPTSRGYLAISEANGMAWVSNDGLAWSAYQIWPSVNNGMRDVAVVSDTIVALRADSAKLGFLRGSLSSMR